MDTSKRVRRFLKFFRTQMDLYHHTDDPSAKQMILNVLVSSLAFHSPSTVERICNQDPQFQRICSEHEGELSRLMLLRFYQWPGGGAALPPDASPVALLQLARKYYNASKRQVDYEALFRDPIYEELTGKRKRRASSSSHRQNEPRDVYPTPPSSPPRRSPPPPPLRLKSNPSPLHWEGPLKINGKVISLHSPKPPSSSSSSSSRKVEQMQWSPTGPQLGSPIGTLAGNEGGKNAGDARAMERAATCIKKNENMLGFKRTDLKRFPIRDLAKRSPKISALFAKIQSLNARDKAGHGHGFKHYIFVNNKQEYGVKLVIAAFLAMDGYNVLNRDKGLAPAKPNENNVGFLVSSLYYGINYDTKRFRSAIMERYNDRASNLHGQSMNIIILDSGFKEGIDLLDVKYVHIFDELKNESEFKQAVGRALRYCGQSGLPYIPGKGWEIEVFTYKLKLPIPIQGAKTAGELYWETIDDQAKKKKKIERLVEGVLDYVSVI